MAGINRRKHVNKGIVNGNFGCCQVLSRSGLAWEMSVVGRSCFFSWEVREGLSEEVKGELRPGSEKMLVWFLNTSEELWPFSVFESSFLTL